MLFKAVIAFSYVLILLLPNVIQAFDINKKKRYLTVRFEHKSRNLHFYSCFVYFVGYIFSVALV